jgi:hypothetical protein
MTMKKISYITVLLVLGFLLTSSQTNAQTIYYDKTHDGFLVFHEINTDVEGFIIPWYNEEPGISYDHVVNLVWNFWDSIRTDLNGLPYYMNHQVWRPSNDPRGLGGDQLNMALSSWRLLYMYSGNERVKENMKFLADYYLSHSLSPSEAEWPDIPFPYNTLTYSGYYDGDMVIGPGYTQPDKAGSFGSELVKLYKITGKGNYLNAAVAIANTLSKHTGEGDQDNSPMPFKVNVSTGETGKLKSNRGDGATVGHSSYTTNWVGTLELFADLIKMEKGNTEAYDVAFNRIIAWMKKYPLQNNKWGPFFEDIPGWSDTQINAVTFARFMMQNPVLFPAMKSQVREILDWVYETLGNHDWEEYGVVVVNEQTVYMTPGNSHTSRQAAAELLYASLSGDHTWYENAIRQLNWATYMVDFDGKNCYPRDEVWLTDGYGDYVRHFLRAMAAEPALAPSNDNHILSSTSVVYQADYAPDLNKRLAREIPLEELETVKIFYKTYDKSSMEIIRMKEKPAKISIWNNILEERDSPDGEGWTWTPLEKGGILKVIHESGNAIKVFVE